MQVLLFCACRKLQAVKGCRGRCMRWTAVKMTSLGLSAEIAPALVPPRLGDLIRSGSRPRPGQSQLSPVPNTHASTHLFAVCFISPPPRDSFILRSLLHLFGICYIWNLASRAHSLSPSIINRLARLIHPFPVLSAKDSSSWPWSCRRECYPSSSL